MLIGSVIAAGSLLDRVPRPGLWLQLSTVLTAATCLTTAWLEPPLPSIVLYGAGLNLGTIVFCLLVLGLLATFFALRTRPDSPNPVLLPADPQDEATADEAVTR